MRFQVFQVKSFDLRIDHLSARRTAHFSAAHDLAHHLLARYDANNTGMTAVLDGIDAFRGPELTGAADWFERLTRAAIRSFALRERRFRPVLPAWCTSDFAGMVPGAWRRTYRAAELPALESPAAGRMASGASIGAVSCLADVLTVLLRECAALLAVAHQCGAEIRVLRRRRSLILARLGRPDVLAFALVLVAACRHYGHRSEPGDHASLLVRQQLVSTGSCLPA